MTGGVSAIILRSLPQGSPRADDFELVRTAEVSLEGESALLRVLYLSIDPGMRSAMRNAGDSRFVVGSPVMGWGLAEVLESTMSALRPGDIVRGRMPWAEQFLARSEQLTALTVVDVQPDIELTSELSALGLPGLVAFFGMHDRGRPVEGESVFVSSAAGAVGALAGQIARAAGARVLGSTRESKIDHVRSLGFEDVFDYQRADPRAELSAWAPQGLNLYFDNVGGAQLQAAFDALAIGGRVVCCGSTSHYDQADGAEFALRGIRTLVTKRLTLSGFTIWDHMDRALAHRAAMLGWLRSGDVRDTVTVREGIGAVPETFIHMLRGDFVGKVMVRVS